MQILFDENLNIDFNKLNVFNITIINYPMKCRKQQKMYIWFAKPVTPATRDCYTNDSRTSPGRGPRVCRQCSGVKTEPGPRPEHSCSDAWHRPGSNPWATAYASTPVIQHSWSKCCLGCWGRVDLCGRSSEEIGDAGIGASARMGIEI